MLIVERQTMNGGTESEGLLRYHREGRPAPANLSTVQAPVPAPAPAPAPAPLLQRPPEPPPPPQITVRAGTRIPLSLRNSVDTKHSHEGDRVYLDTLYPIVVDNRIVIPRGSYVSGTLTTVKPAGAVKGKGELFIRFDSLILPNGVTRDFRSRLASADTTHGTVDHTEGTITGGRDKTGEAKTTRGRRGNRCGNRRTRRRSFRRTSALRRRHRSGRGSRRGTRHRPGQAPPRRVRSARDSPSRCCSIAISITFRLSYRLAKSCAA